MLKYFCVGISLSLAGCLLAGQAQDKTPGTAQHHLQPKSRSFDSEGIRIHFRQLGPSQGEPVISLHGWLSSGDQLIGSATTILLADEGFRVIVPDLRGHGQSDKPHGVEDYGAQMVLDLVRLMDHLKLPKAHLIGYSMGGMIVTKLMVDHPDRVASAVIGGNGGIREAYDFRFVDAFAKSISEGTNLGDALMANWPLLRAGPLDDNLRTMFHAFNDQDGVALSAVASSWRQLMVSQEQLKSVRIPTLVIYGDREMPNNRLFAEELGRLVVDTRTIVIMGEGHMTTPTTAKYQQGIGQFIKQNAGKTVTN
jgi:pimeloyl-ACP methyl ester carboxylesterase